MQNFRLAVLAGGPSPERGISLNSARSILDHCASDSLEVIPIYFDQKRHPYLLSPGQLYSNTPSDFDFCLHERAKPLSPRQLKAELHNVDLVFPAMHGQFGEDGELQAMLEDFDVPFVGAGSAACKQCFDKFTANTFIAEHGFFALPNAVLKIYKRDHEQMIRDFFAAHRLTRAIVKPATGGSSIGVYSVSTPEDALAAVTMLFSKRMDTRVVLEPFARGIEFTVILLQNRFGLPVALIPTEIESDYQDHQIFDYRRKYLPTRQVTFHCPPRFSDAVIEKIQVQAEQLFTLFGMRDVARFDGWVLDNGEVWFADFNPISGMEQNSFLFQQAARLGLSHRAVLGTIIARACQRSGIRPPATRTPHTAPRTPVAVLFGGATSERQVSLMSGTNVWLKLLQSSRYAPTPYLLDPDGSIWRVPYALLLNHTVEEIVQACRRAEVDAARLKRFETSARLRLALEPHVPREAYSTPEHLSWEEFLVGQGFVFLALHGGTGEDGTWQRRLEERGIAFNGSGSATSRLCMDKYATGQALAGLAGQGVLSAPKACYPLHELAACAPSRLDTVWTELTQRLRSKSFIVKPVADGCSSGIVRLGAVSDLHAYLEYTSAGIPRIPANRFTGQLDPVEMPARTPEALLFEPFIETDRVRAVGGELKVTPKTGWMEVTVGVLVEGGRLRALQPSLTIAAGEVLSVEEKFQGGTGINITPPPETLLPPAQRLQVQHRIELVARTLGIDGYARIDAFIERATGNVMVIEVNTLPGLTPSTVLFHQGIAEEPSLMPLALIETIIAAGCETQEHHAMM